MSNDMISMLIIFGFVVLATIVGIIPGAREKLTFEGWAVGGRSFGRFLNWFVLAGEIYTAFTFLGASGWAYSKGGPTFYILVYCGLAYLLSYFILPKISSMGREHKLVSQPDFIRQRYDSKNFGILVAIVAVLFTIPYLQLQLSALGIIMEACSYGAIDRVSAMVIATILVAIFVYTSGLKGVATTAVVKDVIMALVVIFAGIYLPIHYFGGIGNMFQAVEAAKPGYLTLPGATSTMGVGWFMSTILLTSMGFYMWPHLFADSFSAKNPEVLRHNAIFLPIYGICMAFPMLVGFTTLMVIPGLNRPDMAFLTLVSNTFPAWLLGLVGGAGALTAMVPAADLLLASSVLISKNVYKQTIGANASDEFLGRLAKGLVIVLTLISLCLSIYAPSMLVNLLLTSYAGITQIFPAVVLGLFWPKATKWGALTGYVIGVSLVFILLLSKNDPIFGLNAGFVALVANTVSMYAVSLATYKAEDSVTLTNRLSPAEAKE